MQAYFGSYLHSEAQTWLESLANLQTPVADLVTTRGVGVHTTRPI